MYMSEELVLGCFNNEQIYRVDFTMSTSHGYLCSNRHLTHARVHGLHPKDNIQLVTSIYPLNSATISVQLSQKTDVLRATLHTSCMFIKITDYNKFPLKWAQYTGFRVGPRVPDSSEGI